MSNAAETFRQRMRNPLLFRAFLLAKLPLAWAAGLRVRHLDAERCDVSVPFGWRTQNPFRSTYFAAQSMAAELSTGALAMAAVQEAGGRVSMLVVGLSATFENRATGTATFRCQDGAAIAAAVHQALQSGEPATVDAESIGTLPDGTVVSRFRVTWSFKAR
jgi:hypothetical protein